jgi:GH15 family glucan-1,4-alpha-glucosidase
VQIMYGLAGERRLIESEVPWLPGYESSTPVRVGNGAHDQWQLDVYGEVLDAMYQARIGGVASLEAAWAFERALVDHVAATWTEPDEGIWEVRGGRRHFTHSKVMAWVALDRGIKSAERFGLPADLARWCAVRRAIHADVCARGFDPKQQSFVQSYGADALDASLPPGEGAFLPCSFWLADAYTLLGRTTEARALFERVLSLANDLGLLAEEYDAGAGRLVGNFPQAFSHIALVNTAHNLARATKPAQQRAS